MNFVRIYSILFIIIFFIQVVYSSKSVKFNNPDSLIINKTLDSLIKNNKYSNMQYRLSSYDDNIQNIVYSLFQVQEDIDTIIIKSKTSIKPKYLNHLIKNVSQISIDENFNSDIDRKKDRMINKYYFIKKKPIIDIGISASEKIGMLIDISPEFNNLFSGVLGGSKSYNNDWNLNGQIDTQLENVWGSMERVTFKWKNIDSTNQSFNFSLHRPHLLISGVGVTANYNYHLVNNNYTETQFGIDFEFFNRYYGSFYFGFHQGDINSTNEGENKNYYSTSYKALKFTFKNNSLNRIMLPNKGLKLHFDFDIGEDYALNELYFKTNISFMGFSRLQDKINICLKSNINLIKPLKGEIGLSRQINFGGSNSLRGYLDNQFKSTSVSIQSLEMHYSLDNFFKTIIFVDCGIIKNYYPMLSYGFGLKKLSKKAIIGVQYAVPLGVTLQSGKVHLEWMTRL